MECVLCRNLVRENIETMPRFSRFLALLLILLSAPSLRAEMIEGQFGLSGLGAFEGTFNYTPTNATQGTLVITLKNTSPQSGYLTAFVFNNPEDRITAASLTSSDSDFFLLGGPSFNNGVNGAPFGLFDLGASTGGSFQGGGNPSVGIAVGFTETFTFNFTGTQMDTLTTAMFLSEYSDPQGRDAGSEVFVARFRGFRDGGSDKVPLDPPSKAPEPSSLLLACAGLGALAARRRWVR